MKITKRQLKEINKRVKLADAGSDDDLVDLINDAKLMLRVINQLCREVRKVSDYRECVLDVATILDVQLDDEH